ncbi:bile acid:sodium symporter family protein [Bhargavaea cecembensis]|uniref:bile acid:sodium symporter family protein n=1 Tax=Bhargavaea cecembensis TaxID=394098 RepID=UPI00034C11E2|nr:bile acid:sodium symporter family protein [Bhargavaea cecembensis]
MDIIKTIISKYLPFWIVFCAVIAYLFPKAFSGISGWTSIGLGAIFLFMGMSLATSQLVETVKKPKVVLIGVLIKWTMTVTISVGLAYLFFRDQPELATGTILAGTVPSGTTSNLFALLAGGDVALSIAMATTDTFLAPLLTPVLTQFFAGQFIPVSFWALFINIILIVLLPLTTGLFLKWKFTKAVEKVRPFTPLLSQLALFIVVLSVISNAQNVLSDNLSVIPVIAIVVFFQVTVPMVGAYFIARMIGLKEQHARSMLFHVGICNTALAATLALEHVSALSAVPAVLNMVTNLTLGAAIANFFQKRGEEGVQLSKARIKQVQ